jgi:hypothetical protein
MITGSLLFEKADSIFDFKTEFFDNKKPPPARICLSRRKNPLVPPGRVCFNRDDQTHAPGQDCLV